MQHKTRMSEMVRQQDAHHEFFSDEMKHSSIECGKLLSHGKLGHA
jgi:hypothetical protein